MCLVVKRIRHLNGKPKVAKRNILCFKILYMHQSRLLYTPYQSTLVTQDSIKNGLYADYLGNPVTVAGTRCIFLGIHSYKFTRHIVIEPGEIVIKAYIPKGTKYWIGKNGDYVSEVIKFN